MRWAAPLLHSPSEVEAMVDSHIAGPMPDSQTLQRFAEIVTRCIQVRSGGRERRAEGMKEWMGDIPYPPEGKDRGGKLELRE